MNDEENWLDGDDDDLLFAPETEDEGGPGPQDAWTVMIVDDEPAIHDVTKMALTGVSLDGRPLQFLSAYSGAAAKQMLHDHPETAVVLLDVVMEDDHAGLEVARYIRADLQNTAVRIVLRTGQPGQAPETSVITNYDINDYKEKTELTAQKLFTLMYSCLRAYRDITALQASRRGLEKVIEASGNIFEMRNMDTFTQGVLTQIASLLYLDRNAAYIQGDGLAARKGPDGYRVIAGLGAFADLTGREGNPPLAPEVLDDLNKAASTGSTYYDGPRFTSYFRTSHGTENLVHVQGEGNINELDCALLEVFAKNVGIAYENIELHQDLEETQQEIVYMLGEAVETRSRETGNHVKRVAEYSKILALALGMDEDEAEVLRQASPLHDVGKVGIPDAILHKPGKLEGDEWTVMQSHAQIGYDMLKSSRRRVLQAGAVLARDHHEKWCGGGYPTGKAGEEIHIYGRITAVADVFDALGSDRAYKKAWPLEDILDLLRKERGQQFQPEIVDALVDNLDQVLTIRAALQ